MFQPRTNRTPRSRQAGAAMMATLLFGSAVALAAFGGSQTISEVPADFEPLVFFELDDAPESAPPGPPDEPPGGAVAEVEDVPETVEPEVEPETEPEIEPEVVEAEVTEPTPEVPAPTEDAVADLDVGNGILGDGRGGGGGDDPEGTGTCKVNCGSGGDSEYKAVHVSQLRVKRQISPVMPVRARSELGAGDHTCRVRLYVNVEGGVDSVQIEACPSSLQAATLKTIRKWTFHPMLLDDTPRAATAVVNVVYRVD